MVDHVLPSPILPQVTPRNLEGVILTQGVMTRQLLDVLRAHSRAINQIIDYNKIANWASVKEFTSIADAVNAVAGSKTGLYFPSDTYNVSQQIVIPQAIHMKGVGRWRSLINWTNPTLTPFRIATDQPCIIENMQFNGPAGATSGAAIEVSGSAGANTFSIFRDLTFTNGFDHISTVKAYAWIIENCYFSGHAGTAVTVQNTDNVDAGDSTITKCVIANGGASSRGIIQRSSGGLRVINNKILGGQYAYRMELDSGAVTSILIISDNSIELQTVSSISAVSSGGGATFTQVTINGNHIAQTPLGIHLTDATSFMSGVNINANSIALSASGTQIAVLIDNLANFIIDGNIITGTGGTPTGIAVSATANAGLIGTNKYVSLSTEIAVNTLATAVVGPPVRFGSGTPEGVVSAPVGSLFARLDGGAGTSLYVKQSGAGTAGWVGK